MTEISLETYDLQLEGKMQNKILSDILNVGDECTITTMLGFDAKKQSAKVVEYLSTHSGNNQYVVEVESTNRYIRYLDKNGDEAGIDKIKALLMSATDLELEECQDFIKSQMQLLH